MSSELWKDLNREAVEPQKSFQMTVCNLGRVFYNGDVYASINSIVRLANSDRESFFEGLETIKKHIAKMEALLAEKPKKKKNVTSKKKKRTTKKK